MVIKSGDNEYEVSAAGGKDSVLTAPTESFKTLTFDLTSLKLNGQPVIDAATVLNAVSSVMIQVMICITVKTKAADRAVGERLQ